MKCMHEIYEIYIFKLYKLPGNTSLFTQVRTQKDKTNGIHKNLPTFMESAKKGKRFVQTF